MLGDVTGLGGTLPREPVIVFFDQMRMAASQLQVLDLHDSSPTGTGGLGSVLVSTFAIKDGLLAVGGINGGLGPPPAVLYPHTMLVETTCILLDKDGMAHLSESCTPFQRPLG